MHDSSPQSFLSLPLDSTYSFLGASMYSMVLYLLFSISLYRRSAYYIAHFFTVGIPLP
jgi:hypothetical protein